MIPCALICCCRWRRCCFFLFFFSLLHYCFCSLFYCIFSCFAPFVIAVEISPFFSFVYYFSAMMPICTSTHTLLATRSIQYLMVYSIHSRERERRTQTIQNLCGIVCATDVCATVIVVFVVAVFFFFHFIPNRFAGT